jgi:3-oxoacyl-[acyl-carrier protein] reductase
VAAIKSTGGSALAAVGDVLDDGYVKTLVQKAAEFGGGKIHILVNNAGYTWDGVIHKMTDKQWHTIVDLHATAPFKIIREAAPYFRVKDGEPRNIIMISSTSGLNGNAGQINYALAKAGVTGVTKTIAKEYVMSIHLSIYLRGSFPVLTRKPGGARRSGSAPTRSRSGTLRRG